jgi:hypothetical protein
MGMSSQALALCHTQPTQEDRVRNPTSPTPPIVATHPKSPAPGGSSTGRHGTTNVAGQTVALRWQSSRVVNAVGRLAVRWSLDNPDLREDLFQEGWVAAWETELREPGCPLSHLVRSAEDRMLHVRHLGRSVDGRPDGHHDRPRVYEVLRLDQPVRLAGPADRALVEQVSSRQRDVAGEVCGLLHAAAFLALVPPLDRRILSLRLAGYRWAELTRLLPLQPRALHARRAALRELAQQHWTSEVA